MASGAVVGAARAVGAAVSLTAALQQLGCRSGSFSGHLVEAGVRRH
jgi:hypothetical protein